MSAGRAAVPAGAAWLGAAAAWWSGATAVAVIGVCAVAVVAGVWLWPRARRSVVPVTVVCAAAGAGAAGAALAGSGGLPPEEVWNRTVSIEAVVGSGTRDVAAAPGREARVVLSATLTRLAVGSRAWTATTPARVFAATADGWQGLAIGSQVRLHGRVQPPEPGARESTVTAVGPPELLAAPGGVAAVAAGVRAGLHRALAASDRDAASLVLGLTIGDESLQDLRFAEQMRVAGLSHLTAVSGGNTAIVLLAIIMVARLMRLAVPGQVAAAALGLAGYVALVGPEPSVLRAAAMGAAGLAGVLAGGPARGLPVVSACVLVLVLYSPGLAVSLGFALSVVATSALIVVAPVLIRLCRRVPVLDRAPDPVIVAMAVTVAAQASTAPLLLAIGSPVSWVAVPANLLAAPLVVPITILGLLVAIVAPVAPGLAESLAGAAMVPARLLAGIAEQAAAAAGWDLRWLLPFVVILLLAGVTAFLLRSAAGHAHLFAGGAVAAVLALVAAALFLSGRRGSWPQPDWRAIVCDVGQGTAVLLRTGQDTAAMVDVGGAGAGAVRCLHDAGIRSVPVVVLTHFHADHVGGLAEVLAEVPVGSIRTTALAQPAEGAAEVAAAAAQHGVPVTPTGAGETLELGPATGSVLWPAATITGGEDDANNASVVLRTAWPDGFSVLTPGDVEPPAQARLLATAPAAGNDVVVIPHHGSRFQDPRLPSWLGAAVAVASSGENDYGHPAAGTLSAYESVGTHVVRTDDAGSIAVSGSPGSVTVAAG